MDIDILDYNDTELVQIRWKNRDECLDIVSKDGSKLKYCSKVIRDDLEVCSKAIKSYPKAFAFCSTRLKNDKYFCLFAVRKNVDNLKYCSESFRNKKGIMEKEIGIYNSNAFKYLGKELLDDKSFVLKILFKVINPTQINLSHCSDKVKENQIFWFQIANNSYSIICHNISNKTMPKILLKDKNFLLNIAYILRWVHYRKGDEIYSTFQEYLEPDLFDDEGFCTALSALSLTNSNDSKNNWIKLLSEYPEVKNVLPYEIKDDELLTYNLEP